MRAWTSPDVPRIDLGTADPVRVHDTASRTVQVSDPSGAARMYVCGITPYDATHLGHAATYLAFDLLNRAWRDAGHEVAYVQNVTDVDDPLLERATATGVDWVELAERETQLFREDMTALRVLAPDHYVGAVEAIPLVVEMVQQLQQRGHVYDVDGDLYFSVRSDPRFGSVSNLSEDEMRAVFGQRGGDPDRPGKKDPLDCLLWQAERPGEPAWDTVLGRGRPGWHIECSAISLHHLGAELDVQGGGSDLVFPHHEMSASEAQAAFEGLTFARAYVHAGMVGYQGEKMSKSKGNLVLVSRLREAGVDPMAIRLALLAHHYRSDWEWTDADLSAAQDRLAAWRAAVDGASRAQAESLVPVVRQALGDDLDAPAALAAVDAWAAGEPGDGSGADLVRSLLDARLGVVL
ncbi:cysteine--1-D-myo-inosityl 2-amino-2-deoxy-alpha-D-glucopyranoside ligase [Nocardioides panacis]|uniref:L-cysteine:1D-myo-inositol 2-amino-2-deoxy-alpha-D-glucopyranoside ligase n=1 Tax=Nocardioides panacis TaxID=2849501 RepID=A0A975Y1Q7_9ACTN|nr:cysteine--1-D-myo-inosityl 2-amino-2-deoxy-alpha-D-glucopyranoside ligase [Nocardioides panacis]QWZ09756.1 cysteine--1-D-myo-inosityl 2-amino-2-deoxy-alpha-D-glucopyranoside ligase [Nocardioides panacis]